MYIHNSYLSRAAIQSMYISKRHNITFLITLGAQYAYMEFHLYIHTKSSCTFGSIWNVIFALQFIIILLKFVLYASSYNTITTNTKHQPKRNQDVH